MDPPYVTVRFARAHFGAAKASSAVTAIAKAIETVFCMRGFFF